MTPTPPLPLLHLASPYLNVVPLPAASSILALSVINSALPMVLLGRKIMATRVSTTAADWDQDLHETFSFIQLIANFDGRLILRQ